MVVCPMLDAKARRSYGIDWDIVVDALKGTYFVLVLPALTGTSNWNLVGSSVQISTSRLCGAYSGWVYGGGAAE